MSSPRACINALSHTVSAGQSGCCLPVWSRHLLERDQSEWFRFGCPSFADELVGRKAVEGLEPSGEVAGGDEVVETPNELAVQLVMISLDCRVLDRPVHPLDLSVGPGMIGLGQSMFDPVLPTDVPATAKWRRVNRRKGTKGPLATSFAAVRVRIADGPPQRIHEKGMQHMPGEEAWLVGERRASVERKSLSFQPASRRQAQDARRRDQGAMGLRASPPAAQRRTRSRSLRRPLLAWPAPPCTHDDDRLRLPAKPPPRPSRAGEKIPSRAAKADVAGDPARRPIHPRSRAALSMPTLQAHVP